MLSRITAWDVQICKGSYKLPPKRERWGQGMLACEAFGAGDLGTEGGCWEAAGCSIDQEETGAWKGPPLGPGRHAAPAGSVAVASFRSILTILPGMGLHRVSSINLGLRVNGKSPSGTYINIAASSEQVDSLAFRWDGLDECDCRIGCPWLRVYLELCFVMLNYLKVLCM